MTEFSLNQTLHFSLEDKHPISKVVGIDFYRFKADDGEDRNWKSYTLVPINENDKIGVYKRWYIVNLPILGISFVRVINKTDFPNILTEEPKLTGFALVKTGGDGDLGTGKSKIWTYWDKSSSPDQMYAKEAFTDGSDLYFKTNPLVRVPTCP